MTGEESVRGKGGSVRADGEGSPKKIGNRILSFAG
ncbi:hypothetical protein A2U01_0071740, partial [Trifolium medium]|nr:hypothetical protein [Trifolium medium]